MNESLILKYARFRAGRALKNTRPEHYFGSGQYVSSTESNHIGNAIMSVNRGFESGSSLKALPITPERRGEINNQFSEARSRQFGYSPVDSLRLIEEVLVEDPLNPELYLFAGNAFLDSSVRDFSEIRNTSAYNNIIALACFANAGSLQPDSLEAHKGMVTALSLIDSTEEAARLNNKNLKKLIEGSVLIKQGDVVQGVQVLDTVSSDSSYKWLADYNAAYALWENGQDTDAGVVATHAGERLFKMKDFEMAMTLFEFAADTRQDPDSYLNLASVYRKLDMPDASEKALINATHATATTDEEQLTQVEAMRRLRDIVWERGYSLWSEGRHVEAGEVFDESDKILNEAIQFEHQIRRARKARRE